MKIKKSIATAALVAALALTGCGFTSSETDNNSTSEIQSSSEDSNKIYTIDEICTRVDSDKKFERDHKDQIFTIFGEIDSKIYKSVYFKSNIERNSYSKYEIKCEFDDSDKIKELSNGDTVTVSGKLYSLSVGTLTLKECSLVSSGNTENSSENSSDTKQEEIPEPRETAIGKSDKSVDGIMTIKATSVNNDKTGNWKYSAFSESGLDISKYALSYYEEYFNSDKEVHAVVNFADKTTTRISCTSGMLYVTVMEYVDGEEHDADLMFTGDTINDYIVYTDNGDIEDITADEENSSVTPEPPQSSAETTPQSSEPTIETPQSTVSNTEPPKSNVVYIAATGDGKKYHRSPYCSGMDGNVIEMTREEAEANGYTVCKKNSCK